VQESLPKNRALADSAHTSLSFALCSGVVVVPGISGGHLGLRPASTASAFGTAWNGSAHYSGDESVSRIACCTL